jgi:hypothetical protein
VLPAIADLQHECAESAPRLVRVRAYVGVWKAIAICSLADAYREARPTCGRVTRRIAVILPLIMAGIMLPPALNTPRDPAGLRILLLLTSPQVFAVALLLAYYFAVTFEQWTTSPRKLLPAICGMSALFTVLLLVVTMSVVPRANQTYRNAVSARLGGSYHLETGGTEWTFSDLVRRAVGPSPDRAVARRQLSSRFLISTAPIMIGFVALGISGFAPKIALFSGVWVLIFYIAAVRSTALSASQGPAVESVWMVNALFTLGGLWLVWLRRQPHDSGSQSHLPMP